METACKKNNETRKAKIWSLFTSSLHILLLFKSFFIYLFSAFYDTMKHEFLETIQSIEDLSTI